MFVALLGLSACSASDEEAPPPACREGLLSCDIGCVDPLVNPNHCGACGNACHEGEECHEGVCAPLCTDGRTRCGLSCVNLDSNARHCGACGVVCESGEHCVEGSCEALRCDEGMEVCGEACVDTRTDAQNCGVCGRACAEGDVCSQGHCSDRCEEGFQACVGGCFDLERDRRHCGDCGRACSTGDVCDQGRCVRDCAEGRQDCGGVCADVKTDAEHCGHCHNACDEGFACVSGQCACPAGWVKCGGECVDTQSNPEHCGNCDQRCIADELSNVSKATCEAGSCKVSCEGAFELCSEDWSSGCLVDLQSSDENCGDCGIDCNVGANLRSGSCLAGSCEILAGGCENGWGDCNRFHGDGCETDLLDTIEHCGNCGVSCLAGPRVSAAACEDGACLLTCEEGWGDCDKDPKTGCEHDVLKDPANCGACGTACEAGDRCVDGVCTRDDEWPNWPLPPDAVDASNYEIQGEVVVDKTTDLRWRRSVATGTYTWAQAKAHCPTLGAGWRLPSVVELLSIVKADASSPAIETDVFLGTSTGSPANFWSSTPSKKTPANGWAVNFASGSTSVQSAGNTMQVRCVQTGEENPGERRVLYYDGENGQLILDEKTGLLWFAQDSGHTGGTNQANAASYCNTRGLGGQSGFRLPTKRELESIVDRRANDPAVENAVFKGVGSDRSFWTSTPVHGQANRFWTLNFQQGTSETALSSANLYVRCVKNFGG